MRQNCAMGLFDLSEYKKKKQRADESATDPRAFPVALSEVLFDGRKQTLRFEPVLLDGGHVFIAFRPEKHGPEFNLIVGRGDAKGRDYVPIEVETERAFKPEAWLKDARSGVEEGVFGRLRVEQSPMELRYGFFASNGQMQTVEYQFYMDGNYGNFMASRTAQYDPWPEVEAWAAPADAPTLLLELDETEFLAHLEREKADFHSIYGISSRWNEMSFEEKHALLPDFEKEIEREIVPLMRAVVWSEPSLGRGGMLQFVSESEKPFWRRPRFWIKPDRDKGETLYFDKRFETRILKIWPHIVARFLPRFESLDKEEVHPAVLHWMKYRGAYLIEFEMPNAHEHLEARLLLRDFLFERGVSLEKLES